MILCNFSMLEDEAEECEEETNSSKMEKREPLIDLMDVGMHRKAQYLLYRHVEESVLIWWCWSVVSLGHSVLCFTPSTRSSS